MEEIERHLQSIIDRAQAQRAAGNILPEEPGERPCQICQGAGYLRYDVPPDDSRFGELIICECKKDELEEKRQVLLRKRSQLDLVPNYTFDDWEVKIAKGVPPAKHPDGAYHIAQLYAESLSFDGRPWLFLYGTKGTGKTHLAAAVAHYRVEHGQPAIFVPVPDMLDDLRESYGAGAEMPYDELLHAYRTTQLLILDDIGTHYATDWAREKLFQLVNSRNNRRLPTIVTMNSEYAPIEERLWSRIIDRKLTTTYEIKAPDWRESRTAPKQPPAPASGYTRARNPKVSYTDRT